MADDLALKGLVTAVACWQAYAATIPGGSVHRLTGVDVAVFTDGPERDVFNNAVLAPGLDDDGRRHAVASMARVYADAGVTAFAAWVLERDLAMRADLERWGYTHQETTWAMGLDLSAASAQVEEWRTELGPPDWQEYLRVLELPAGLLTKADPRQFNVLIALLDGVGTSTMMTFDHDGDCGIYNVATLATGRRRGLATGMMRHALSDAHERGCRTATLQATEMARGVYKGLGFVDLGRILEFGPPR